MKYSCSIQINLPIDKTVKLWSDEQHFSKWQDGFVRIEHLKGEPNTKGAKSKILFSGKQEMELIETILVNNLPEEKTALYEHKHMSNTQTSRFFAEDENSTTYISEVEYIIFNGFLIRLFAKLFPSKFKQQSEKWIKQFKEFAENHN